MLKPGTVKQACKPNIQEADASRLRVPGQPGLEQDSVSRNRQVSINIYAPSQVPGKRSKKCHLCLVLQVKWMQKRSQRGKKKKLGMVVAHPPSIPALSRQRQVDVWVGSQPGLCGETLPQKKKNTQKSFNYVNMLTSKIPTSYGLPATCNAQVPVYFRV